MSRQRLDKELVRRRLAASLTEALHLIEEGLVVVEGNPSPKAATQVRAESSIRIERALHPYVGRGGLKLAAALDHFALDPSGWRAVDVGASTGGFTDCLLQRGAASVAAVDVGYGQLAWSLQSDPRVTVWDRTNIRLADPTALGAPFDAIVGDLSFISLCAVAHQLAGLGAADSVWVLLVKPQFEVGREGLARGGIVRDPMQRLSAVESVITCLAAVGLGAADVLPSPIQGAKAGNTEFLLLLRRGQRALDAARLSEVVT